MAKLETTKLAILATCLNGAADSGKYGRITTEVVKEELANGDIFAFLSRELDSDVDLSKLTDVDRHKLLQHWCTFAKAYKTRQFHVSGSGLALLVAYLRHIIYISHVVAPR